MFLGGVFFYFAVVAATQLDLSSVIIPVVVNANESRPLGSSALLWTGSQAATADRCN